MQFGLMVPNIGPFGDARTLVELARLAEDAGWDGFFNWDTIQMAEAEGLPVVDAWIAMAAIAAQTERIRIGPRVAAPPRMRPWVLAQQAVALDHLSRGRLILGVGSGDSSDRGFTAFGEAIDARDRAEMLDESLAILDGLWTGEPFAYSGTHYRFDAFQLLPRPIQQPRIPIWVAGTWPKPRPMARAARWDGVSPFTISSDGAYSELQPDDVAGLRRLGDERRGQGSRWEIAIDAPVLTAQTDDTARAHLRSIADAGATWAIEAVSHTQDIDQLKAAIRRGPPRLNRSS